MTDPDNGDLDIPVIYIGEALARAIFCHLKFFNRFTRCNVFPHASLPTYPAVTECYPAVAECYPASLGWVFHQG
jgi:hypothetical protein